MAAPGRQPLAYIPVPLLLRPHVPDNDNHYKDRVYIPVPRDFEPVFYITAGAKEFYVRFDTIP